MTKSRVQFNARVEPKMHESVVKVCDYLGCTRDEFMRVAIATLFGSKDGLVREQRKKIQEAASNLKVSPFNRPDHQFDRDLIAA